MPLISDRHHSKKSFELHHYNACKHPNVENKERILQ